MPSIRERVRADGTRVFRAQVRMNGFPARAATFPSKRLAERWAKTIEGFLRLRGIGLRRAENTRVGGSIPPPASKSHGS